MHTCFLILLCTYYQNWFNDQKFEAPGSKMSARLQKSFTMNYSKGLSLLFSLLFYSFLNKEFFDMYKMYVILECIRNINYRLIT